MIVPKGKGSLLQIATNWKCNAQCVFCGLTMRKELSKVPDMPFSFYKNLVDQCSFVKMVQPQGINEPLCYSHIVECVEYAARKGKYVFFYTNGSLMSDSMAQNLLDAGLSEVRFSIDACSKRGYEQLRRGLSWNTLVQNVENFQKLKDKKGYDCKTLVRVTKVKENRKSIDGIVTFWSKRVDRVRVCYEDVVPSSDWIKREPWASKKIKLARTCTKPWKHITIKPNGDMVTCCKDWYADYVMANVHEVSVLEGFNSKKFNDIRQRMRNQTNYPMICVYCKTPSKR